MAKRWHPDIAPAGKRQAHEDHIKVLNQAADELESLLDSMPGGSLSANALRVSADAARKRRAEEGRKNYEQQKNEAERRAEQQQNDPFHSQVPDHSVVYRYARCNAYPEWGVGSILGIYFTGEGDNIQQWAASTSKSAFAQSLRGPSTSSSSASRTTGRSDPAGSCSAQSTRWPKAISRSPHGD